MVRKSEVVFGLQELASILLRNQNTQEFLPWIFCFQTSHGVSVCKLCDPFAQRSYTVKDAAIVNNRDFSGAVACDSRYGWVLFLKMIYGL